MLRLREFGGIVIERGGVPVAETAELHKALSLLAMVAVSRDRGISRDQLTAFLWPESQTAQARAALSQTLYTLRRQLAEPALFVGSRTLRLNPLSIGSDLLDFEQALERDDLEAAVELYSGAFLQGFFVSNAGELERWIESQRADLAERWAAAIEALARRASDRGDYATAVRWWRRLIDTVPGNSRTVVALVEALAAAGDRAGALQAAQAHEAFLRSEFDAPPDPSVSALVSQIRQGGVVAGAEPRIESHSLSNGTQTAPVHDEPSGPVAGASRVAVTAPEAAVRGSSLTRAPSSAPGRSGRGGVRRVATLVAATGVLSAASVIAAWVDGAGARHDAPAFSERRIAVTPFRNETGDSALASVGRTAVDWVVLMLTQTQLVEVVAPNIREGSLPPADGSGRSPNAGLIVRGSYSRVADSLVLQAQIVEAATGRVVRAVGPVSGPFQQPLVAIERLRQGLAGALATRVDRRLSRWSDAAGQPASFEAYRAFDEGLTAFFSADFQRAGSLLVHSAALDSTFNLPLVWAFYAYYNGGDQVRNDSVLRVLESRRDRLPRLDRALLDALVAFSRYDPVARYEAFRRVAAIAPNSEWLYKLAEAAEEAHFFAEADSALAALEPDAGWMREWRNYWPLRAGIAYSQGRHETELEYAMRIPRAHPGDGPDSRAGVALAALGRKAELLTMVDEALASTPPRIGWHGLYRITSAARVHGHVDIAAEIAKRALRAPVPGAYMGDSIRARARSQLLVYDASENWTAAVVSAKELIRVNSLQGHPDALPYLVLLEAAVRRGALRDTAGLEAKALAEATARPSADGPMNWFSEHPLVVQAELAALRGDVKRTAAALQEAVKRNSWDPKTDFGPFERSAFDRVRNDPSLANLLHVPALDRPRSTPSSP